MSSDPEAEGLSRRSPRRLPPDGAGGVPPSGDGSGPGARDDLLLLGEPVPSALLEMFLAVMPDAAVVVDGHGRIVAANPGAGELFGYPAEALIGRPVEVLLPERFRGEHRRHRASYGDSPRTRAMGAGRELSGLRRDGSEVPVDVSLAPLSGADRPLVVAAIRDVSERRAATAAQARLAAIVEYSVDAILAIDMHGVVTSWNPGAERLFGHPAERVVGGHIDVILSDAAVMEFEGLLAAVAAGRPAEACDTRWRTRHGELVDVAISVSPIRDPAGEPGGFSVLARDITRRKLAEADLRRQERWQAANAEIRMALLSGVSIPSVLELICRRAAELVEAASAVILTADGDAVRAVASHGPAAPPPGRALHPPPLIVSRAVAGARTEVEAGPGAVDVGASDQAGDGLGPGPRLAAPLLSDGTSRGALVLIRDSGTNAFTPAETLVAESFAGQAGLALELADAVHRREELLLAEERDRIARDLHDLVIQRLFSTGLALAAVSPLVGDGRVASRLGGAVDELDTVIREIRQTIFALETPAPAASGVRAQVQRMAVAASDGLGFEPAVRFDGPVDNAVPHEVVPHLLAVVREALSNIARHAHATHAEVHLSAGDDLIVVIADNGVGLGTPARHSGLRNCRFRAERLGGTLDLTAAPGGGTRLEWRVPIGRHSDG